VNAIGDAVYKYQELGWVVVVFIMEVGKGAPSYDGFCSSLGLVAFVLLSSQRLRDRGVFG